MTRAAVLLLAGAVLAACGSVPPARDTAAATATAQWPADRQIVITVRNGASPVPQNAGSSGKNYGALGRYRPSAAALRGADAIARRHGLRQLAAWPIEVLGVHCIVYGIDGTRGLGAVIEEVAADRDVESVQPMRTFHVQSGSPGSTYDDPYLKLQDSLATMQVADAHGMSRGRGVRVAVVDSGIDATHPELAHRIVFDRDVTGLAVDGTRDLHGTAVAGIIAANAGNGLGIVGIAPEADLLALRACWQAPRPVGSPVSVCNTLTLAQALALAITERADVINLSLTGPDDPLLERLLKRALSMGKVIVAAVPEEGAKDAGFPASLPGVLAVASAEAPAMAVSRPPGVLYAPGRNILTLRPGGRYDFENGSSMAAASVSGIVALLMSVRPRLMPAQIDKLLHDGANWSVQADTRSGPVVNACRAVEALAGGARCGELRNMHATRQ